MRPEERNTAYLWDMRLYGLRAMDLVRGLDYAAFLSDWQTRLAVERTVEIVGEAARRVSPEFQQAHPEIAWRDMIGQRNILAHDYGSIDPEEIWKSATESLPVLIPQLDALLPPPPSEEV